MFVFFFLPGMQECLNVCKSINTIRHINRMSTKTLDHLNRCKKEFDKK